MWRDNLIDDYVDSLTEVKEIRKVSGTEELTKLEMIEYRKVVGKFNWLAQSTRIDLCYKSIRMAKRNKEAKVYNLKIINYVLK